MRVLGYTSPARGHLNPMMGPLLALRERGAEVHVRTLAPAVQPVRAAGLACEPIDPAIEAIEMDDHRERSQVKAGGRAYAVWARRAQLEVGDFAAALGEVRPDLALVDVSTFGAKAVAEREGLAWAESRPFLLDDPAPGAPPFGFGLRPARGRLGRSRDRFLAAVARKFDAAARLPAANAGREAAGLAPLPRIEETRCRAALTLYFTAPPFEFDRPMPPGVLMVGAGTWDPPGQSTPDVPEDDRPLVLVTCSSEFQDDAAIAATALRGLAGPRRLVVTTAGVDPDSLPIAADAVVARYLPHGPLLDRAAAVVCHGGMGITQKALAHGVPVCVVPWGRDQLDVAARVVHAGAGVKVSRRRLTPARLATAVAATERMADGARRVNEGFEATGGSTAAADALEGLVARR